MAIPLLVKVDSTVDLVWAGDDSVTVPEGESGWWETSDPAVRFNGTSDKITIRPLNGEESARAQRMEDIISTFYAVCDWGVTARNGDAYEVQKWLRNIPNLAVYQLCNAIYSVTAGKSIRIKVEEKKRRKKKKKG